MIEELAEKPTFQQSYLQQWLSETTAGIKFEIENKFGNINQREAKS